MFFKEGYRLPAEWEAQSGVQLTWPHAGTDWAPMLQEITATYEEMAREISKREPLLVVAPKGTPLPSMGAWSMVNTNDTWARDHGFITLVPTTTHQQPLLLDFRFNGWGEKFLSDWDNQIPQKLWESLALVGKAGYENHQDFVLEGGSIDTDGQGTLFTTSQCLLAPHRNQPLTQAEIEEQLKRRLRVSRVVWLDHGNLVGDDTDGHIDTIVRCAPENTLVYVGCDDTDDEQYEDFLALENQLKALRTADGRPYRLLRLPMPDAIYEGEGTWDNGQEGSFEGQEERGKGQEAERLPATYANFLIINGAVLVPTYAQPEKDAEAMRIIQQAFPDREMIGIDARTIIRQHGSVHCLTMQVPSGEE